MMALVARAARPAPVMACVHCERTEHLVLGDGPVLVCRPCVDLLCGAVLDPTAIGTGLLTHLRKRHRAVVALMEAATGHPAWAWIAGWPEAKA